MGDEYRDVTVTNDVTSTERGMDITTCIRCPTDDCTALLPVDEYTECHECGVRLELAARIVAPPVDDTSE